VHFTSAFDKCIWLSVFPVFIPCMHLRYFNGFVLVFICVYVDITDGMSELKIEQEKTKQKQLECETETQRRKAEEEKRKAEEEKRKAEEEKRKAEEEKTKQVLLQQG